MTKIPTLYNRLKPKVRAKLKENEGKYSSSVREVIAKLENKCTRLSSSTVKSPIKYLLSSLAITSLTDELYLPSFSLSFALTLGFSLL